MSAPTLWQATHDREYAYLHTRDARGGQPANMRDSIMHWFVDSPDGMPTPAQARDVAIRLPGLAYYPYCEKRHRAAAKIGRSWRAVCANPAYGVCRRRLLREFADLTAARSC